MTGELDPTYSAGPDRPELATFNPSFDALLAHARATGDSSSETTLRTLRADLFAATQGETPPEVLEDGQPASGDAQDTV